MATIYNIRSIEIISVTTITYIGSINDPDKYSYVDTIGNSYTFYNRTGQVARDGDFIILNDDDVNLLMPRSTYVSTYGLDEDSSISGMVIATNTSNTALDAGATFTGSWVDVTGYPDISICVSTDQNGTLYVQYSPDGTNIDSNITRYYRTTQIEAPHIFKNARPYFRVVFTNTSASNQTYFRLVTMAGDRGQLNIPIDSMMAQDYDSISVRPTEYNYEVALSRRQGATTWNKFGYNADVDVGTEVIAAFGGTFTPLTTASTLTIVSSSANDDGSPAGTGANSIVIYGVDANRVAQTEVVTLNGTTNVVTSTTWLGINRASIYLAGSGLSNAGLITITATTGGSTQATIPIGEGSTQQSIFFTQLNHTFLADTLILNAEKTGAGASPKVRFKGWVFSEVSNAKYLVFNQLLDTSAENAAVLTPTQPFVIGEKSVLWFEATTDQADTFASIRFSGIEIRDVDA